MGRFASTQRVAGVAARHPWLTILLWVVILGAAVFSAVSLGDVLSDDGGSGGSSEAARAQRIIEERLRADEPPQEFIVVEASDEVGREDLDRLVESLTARLRSLDEVVAVASHLDTDAGLLTADGRIALVQVTLAGDEADATEAAVPVVEAVAAADDTEGFHVTVVGVGSINGEFEELAKETLERGELIGVGVGLVILLLVFGAAVAAGLPLLLGVASIVVALGATAVVGRAIEMSSFVTNIITMIGLAVGIDYTLFIVQRFREERAHGLERLEAIQRAAGTATRAVVFSGVAVVIALSGLLILPDSTLRAFGVGAILSVVVAVAAALTLLPAVLGLLGDRVNRFSLPLVGRRGSSERGEGFWGRVTRVVTARPLVSVVVAGGVLVGASTLFANIQLGTNGVSSLPADSGGRHAFEVINEHFTDGVLASDVVIDAADVSAPAVAAGVDRLVALLAADTFYGDTAYEANASGDVAVLRVAMRGDFASAEARDALERLRGDYIPRAFAGVEADVLVTGDAAWVVDSVAETWHYMPIVMAFVLGLSFVLLAVVFRSVVVPLKAVAMNLLSVGAAYGLLVLVFQEGVGADLFGFHQTPVIESWLPLFLFSILFGLSMDYHVFLLSRIKERYDEVRDNSAAVEYGLRSTGSIITGAALIMVAVFGGFALGDLAMFEQMGFGLAVAIIVDATIVRSVLVPASMELLGDWNWYFPRWLEWLPRIDIEGSRAEAQPGREPAPLVAQPIPQHPAR